MTWSIRQTVFYWIMLVFSLAYVATIAVATAQDLPIDKPVPWAESLTKQIAEAEQCELAFIINVREYKLAGNNVIDGRLRCADTREYFFNRSGEKEDFKFEKCTEAVC